MICVPTCAAPATVGGQSSFQNHKSIRPDDTGRQLFRTCRASCPPHLTTYTARNGTVVFPSGHVRQIVSGRGVAHGNREMPAWADAFRSARGGLSPDRVAASVDSIVRCLETNQERAAE
jgi:hypothetical protein